MTQKETSSTRPGQLDPQSPVDYYAKMALDPRLIDYVRHQVKQMENDSSGLWTGLGKAIANRMKEIK